MSELKVGSKAPEFKGFDQNENIIQLSNYDDKKLILYFYPKDNTPGCTKEACNLRDNYDQLKKFRKSAITSNLNADVKQKTNQVINSKLLNETIKCLDKQKHWNKNIPNMVKLYFIEMTNFLNTLKKKMKKNSKIGIVVGNSSYQGVPVAADLILSEIAKSLGYKIKEIIVTRNNETSSQQYKKIGNLIKYIRESIIILK